MGMDAQNYVKLKKVLLVWKVKDAISLNVGIALLNLLGKLVTMGT